MGFIEIRPEMTTGNKGIDTHHRHLVELFNTFLRAFRMHKHKSQFLWLWKMPGFSTHPSRVSRC
jgi:hemerythrin